MRTITVRQQVAKSLKSRQYRESVTRANIREGIAAQIRATRERRTWTQRELGQRAKMAQEVISNLEDPDYGPPTVRTLQRLAAAFDVALVVRFVPFSQLVDWIANLDQSDLAVPSFDDEQKLEATVQGISSR